MYYTNNIDENEDHITQVLEETEEFLKKKRK